MGGDFECTECGRIKVSIDHYHFWITFGYRDRTGGSDWLVVRHLFADGLTVYSPPTGNHYFPLAPPSETLRSLVEHFHITKAVMPLCDRLIEEYPELEPHIMALVVNVAKVGV